MHTGYHALIGAAAHITINPPRSIISFSPVVLPAPCRRVEAAVPELKGHLDRTWVAVSGHSAWGWTASVLLGTSNTDPRDGFTWYELETRIKAGMDPRRHRKRQRGYYGPWKESRPLLWPELWHNGHVMYGDEDLSPCLTTRGADWRAGPYALALGPNDLLTLEGAKHGLGGISGWDAGETLDESPERLAVVQRMTWAYLSSQLFDGDSASVERCRALEGLEVLGKVESKRMPTMHEVFAWMLDEDEE